MAPRACGLRALEALHREVYGARSPHFPVAPRTAGQEYTGTVPTPSQSCPCVLTARCCCPGARVAPLCPRPLRASAGLAEPVVAPWLTHTPRSPVSLMSSALNLTDSSSPRPDAAPPSAALHRHPEIALHLQHSLLPIGPFCSHSPAVLPPQGCSAQTEPGDQSPW